MKALVKRYRYFIGTIIFVSLLTLFNYQIGIKAFSIAGFSFKEMALVIPPVFVLLGLLDVWVPRETMMKYMGEGSGIKGVVLAILLGAAAAGPLFHTSVSMATLPSSILAGILWDKLGPSAPFIFGGMLSLISSILIIVMIKLKKENIYE